MADQPHHEDDQDDDPQQEAGDRPRSEPPSWEIADDQSEIDEEMPPLAGNPPGIGTPMTPPPEPEPESPATEDQTPESVESSDSEGDQPSSGERYRMRPPERYYNQNQENEIEEDDDFLHLGDPTNVAFTADPDIGPGESEPPPPEEEKPAVPFPVAPVTNTGALSKREKIFVGAAVAVVFLFVVGAFIMIKSLEPGFKPNALVESAPLPLTGEFAAVRDIEVRWVENPEHGNVSHAPMATIEFANDSPEGALRIFFLNQLGRQIGDTQNVRAAPGETITVVGTGGLDRELDYLDLRATGRDYWSVRIVEGPSTTAPIADFRPLVHLRIPWTLSEQP